MIELLELDAARQLWNRPRKPEATTITMLQNAADTQVSSLSAECRPMNIGPIVPAIRWKSNHIVFDASQRNSLMRLKIG